MPAGTPTDKTELYLIVSLEAGADVAVQRDRLSKALQTLPVPAVLVTDLPDADAANQGTDVRSLISLVQGFNRAAMVPNDPDLARALNADGVHLSWRSSVTTDFATAHAQGGELMMGAEAGKSRHDAMMLAEAGADYVGFGVPADLKDQETARTRQMDLLLWWAELFEVPVVAFDINTPEQAQAAIDAGADFLAVTLPPNSADESAFDTWLRGFTALLPTPTT